MKILGGGRDGHDACLAPKDDKHEFNLSYILRQLEAMRDEPPADELHILLQLQPGEQHDGMPAAPAPTQDVLGVVAAVARQSRRAFTVEFRAIYVVPELRGSSIAAALVHLALDDVDKQTEQRMRSGWPMPWGASEFGSRREDKAFVLLPHCMQTSKSFWKRMGFGIGEEVDRKEHKQAVLLSRDDLPPKPRWLYEYRTAGAA